MFKETPDSQTYHCEACEVKARGGLVTEQHACGTKKEPYKGQSYRQGFLAGSKEGFGLGFKAGLRKALEVKPVKGFVKYITPGGKKKKHENRWYNSALFSWDENLRKEIEKLK